jgi:hypothetical protein
MKLQFLIKTLSIFNNISLKVYFVIIDYNIIVFFELKIY